MARALNRTLIVVVALALPTAATAETKGKLRTTQMCIDQEISDRLSMKRKRRGAVDRLYVKQERHEFSAIGGYYVSDLFSATYALGGSYTFHMTESTAVELGALWTHENAEVIRAVEDNRGTTIEDDFARSFIVESVLVWSPFYGKLRVGGKVMRFDMHLDAGVGVVDSPTSSDITGIAGIGYKLFLSQAIALRLDFRDHIYKQELLEDSFLVNDLSVTAGISVFVPFSN